MCCSVSTFMSLYNHKDGFKRTKFAFQVREKNPKQVTKPKIFHGVLLQSLSFPLQPLFTSQWGPSCWSPSQKPATPPLAGRTVTTRSNRSHRRDREARERRPYRERHGVPSLRHDHLCRKPVDRDHLMEEITQRSLKKKHSVCPAEVSN